MRYPAESARKVVANLDEIERLAKHVANDGAWPGRTRPVAYYVGDFANKLLALLLGADEEWRKSELLFLQRYHNDNSSIHDDLKWAKETVPADVRWMVPPFFSAACQCDLRHGTHVAATMLQRITKICELACDADGVAVNEERGLCQEVLGALQGELHRWGLEAQPQVEPAATLEVSHGPPAFEDKPSVIEVASGEQRRSQTQASPVGRTLPREPESSGDIQRAISIRQPLVELILRGEKQYEYRSKATRIRERVFLYASAKPFPDQALWESLGMRPGDLPTGLILGSVAITGCDFDTSASCFAYKLSDPQRLSHPIVPRNQPQPVFWRPQF